MLGTLRLPLMLVLASSPAARGRHEHRRQRRGGGLGRVRHAREGRVDWRIVAWMAPPSVVGAVLGGVFGDRVPERRCSWRRAVLAWQGSTCSHRPFHESPREEPRIAPGGVGGLVIGAIGGALGVILGTLRMPALLRGVGLPAAKAVGTNLVVGFFLGVAGFAAHAARLEVDWDLLAAGLSARSRAAGWARGRPGSCPR